MVQTPRVHKNRLTVMMPAIPPALSVGAQYSSYCGRAHRNEGERVLQEMTGGSGGSGFRLQELDRSHDKYESVKTQFTSKWQKGNVPTVENIFLIKVSRYICLRSLYKVSCVLH